MAKIGVVREIPISDLRPYERNAKVHGPEQVQKIADSISEFGFISPCLVDEDLNVIAGHGRIMAAKLLGMEAVPCVYVEGLTEEQRRAYILADNRLTELGDWDMGLVNEELEDLQAAGFDVALTGFELGAAPDLSDEEKYTPKVDIPHYEPSGEVTFVEELVYTAKADRLISEIQASDLPESEKAFLTMAAYRHLRFDYAKIADYYAGASEDMQELMERSALVIIDIDNAIRDGYVELGAALADIIQEAREEGGK